MTEPRAIILCWTPQSFTGWGNFAINLCLWLESTGKAAPAVAAKLGFEAIRLDAMRLYRLAPTIERSRVLQEALARYPGNAPSIAETCLHALGNDLVRQGAAIGDRLLAGRPNIGLVFNESATLSPQGRVNAQPFDLIVAGSTWTANRLAAQKLSCQVTLVQQGVDTTLFRPGPGLRLWHDRFVVFSGGKLEYRKGQDLVLQAFKAFAQRHPDALLVTAWGSGYRRQFVGLSGLPGLSDPQLMSDGRPDVAAWAHASGIPPGSVLDLGLVDHAQFAAILREIDIGLFPNRCESGTNLVAMEAMASGVPLILSANTGHLDLIGDGAHCVAVASDGPVDARRAEVDDISDWGSPAVDELVAALERAYRQRESLRALGLAGAAYVDRFNWGAQAARFMAAFEAVRPA